MSQFEFIIPLSKEELLKKRNINDYVVSEVLCSKSLGRLLEKVTNEYRSSGPTVILSHFDFFYSVIEHFKTSDVDFNLSAWHLIIKIARSLASDLDSALDTDSMQPKSRLQFKNMLKMTTYLACHLAEAFEFHVSVVATSQNATKASKKKIPPVVDDWERERSGWLRLLLSLVQLPIINLWVPHVLEEQFVKLVTNICYKTIENTSANKFREEREHIANIIGIMVKKHSHSFNCVLRLMQLLQNYENLVPSVAFIISMVCDQYGCQTIVAEIMREIGRMDSTLLAQDSLNTKNLAALLLEMSKLNPHPVFQSIFLVIDLLDEESHTMRNGLVGVLGELILRVLKDGLDAKLKVVKQSFFNRLQAHILDVNAFVRCKTLSVWNNLLNEKAVPLLVMNSIMALVAGRVADKSSMVRKAAVKLLTVLIKSNSISTKFTVEEVKEEYEKEVKVLEAMQAERKKKKQEDKEQKKDGDEEEEEDEDETKIDEDTTMTEKTDEEADDNDAEFYKQKALVSYLKNSYEFLEEVKSSIKFISCLLRSETSSDVVEAINFFYIGYQEGLKTCSVGIDMMLPLVCSKELEIRNAVVEAYQSIYLEPKMTEVPRPAAVMIAESLMQLAVSCNKFGQRVALEKLMGEFMSRGCINDAVVKVLWNKFTSENKKNSCISLVLIRAISADQIEMIQSNMDTIIETALQPPDVHFLVATEALITLSKMAAIKKNTDEGPFRLPNDHKLFECIIRLMTSGMEQTERLDWTPLCDQAISAVYKLAEHPDLICEDIIKHQAKLLLGDDNLNQLTPLIEEELPLTQNSVMPSQSQPSIPTQSKLVVSSCLLTRFLCTVGNVALRQLTFFDLFVYNELKRQKLLKKGKKADKQYDVTTASISRSEASMRKQQEVEENWAEDSEAEFILHITEKEMLFAKDSLLGVLRPLILSVCQSQHKYDDVRLCVSATSALCKFMLVSSEFCQSNIRLLFTLLERSPHALVRSTIFIALSDLVQRFPNLIEPWTPNMYSRLADECPNVRLAAVLVLTRLILKDMIMVKGQISELALSILDENEKIASAAKTFFVEFSKKPNSIYNALPDVMSRLAEESSRCSQQQFKPIMKFLISFIEKEKQAENLISKFCFRVRDTSNTKHAQDLCYCLSLLPLNDKCVQQLIDNASCFLDHLSDDVVVENIHMVISNAKKYAKVGSKSHVSQFETWVTNQVDRLRAQKGNEEQEETRDPLIESFIASHTPKSSKKLKGTQKKKPNKPISKKKMRIEDSDDDDDDDDDIEFDEGNENESKNKRIRSPSTSAPEQEEGRRVARKKKA